jgi:hypothetical protein
MRHSGTAEDMDPAKKFTDLRARVVGHRVTFKRLAGNSLLVYFGGEPGDRQGVTLWFEPTWHFRDSSRVLTGSREAQHDSDAVDPDAGFHRAATALEIVKGQEARDLRVDPVTGDLILELDGGQLLSTFVSDPSTDELWHIRDNSTGDRLLRSGSGFEILVGDA